LRVSRSDEFERFIEAESEAGDRGRDDEIAP